MFYLTFYSTTVSLFLVDVANIEKSMEELLLLLSENREAAFLYGD